MRPGQHFCDALQKGAAPPQHASPYRTTPPQHILNEGLNPTVPQHLSFCVVLCVVCPRQQIKYSGSYAIPPQQARRSWSRPSNCSNRSTSRPWQQVFWVRSYCCPAHVRSLTAPARSGATASRSKASSRATLVLWLGLGVGVMVAPMEAV